MELSTSQTQLSKISPSKTWVFFLCSVLFLSQKVYKAQILSMSIELAIDLISAIEMLFLSKITQYFLSEAFSNQVYLKCHSASSWIHPRFRFLNPHCHLFFSSIHPIQMSAYSCRTAYHCSFFLILLIAHTCIDSVLPSCDILLPATSNNSELSIMQEKRSIFMFR